MQSSDITLEYLQGRPLSYSSLKQFQKSPRHYLHYVSQPRGEGQKSDEMLLGNVFEDMLLEPDIVEGKYGFCPPLNKSTKEGKAKYQQVVDENPGKTIVRYNMKQAAEDMVAAVMACPQAMELINEGGTVQRTITWTDRKTGLPVVAKIDLEGSGRSFILDLKSASDASPKAFARQCLNLDYTLQTGTYRTAYKHNFFEFPPFFNIAVEYKPPYCVAAYRTTDDYLKYGEKQFQQLMDRFKYCMSHDKFNESYHFLSSLPQLPLDIPIWAKKSD